VQEQRGKSGIIYCNSRAKVEDTAARLQSRGFSAAAYHAGLENHIRADVQEKFQRDDLQIVVATVAFGMGIKPTSALWCISTSRAISNPTIRKPAAPGVMACLRKRCCFTIRRIWRGCAAVWRRNRRAAAGY
jgi:hypothetical protein